MKIRNREKIKSNIKESKMYLFLQQIFICCFPSQTCIHPLIRDYKLDTSDSLVNCIPYPLEPVCLLWLGHQSLETAAESDWSLSVSDGPLIFYVYLNYSTLSLAPSGGTGSDDHSGLGRRCLSSWKNQQTAQCFQQRKIL